MQAHYHSINTFGTVDGPGIRYVLFLAGCELACSFCHNPDTWVKSGKTITVTEVIKEMEEYRSFYDSSGGGITVSGGEPLLQPDFVAALFEQCHMHGIHTIIDTSGFVRLDALEKVLPHTDALLFSLKAADNNVHRQLTGKSNELIIANLIHAAAKCPMTLRYVIIPGINDSDSDLKQLADLVKKLPTTVRLDLLPYHTMGITKWEALKIPYKLTHVPQATEADVKRVKTFLLQAGLQNKYLG